MCTKFIGLFFILCHSPRVALFTWALSLSLSQHAVPVDQVRSRPGRTYPIRRHRVSGSPSVFTLGLLFFFFVKMGMVQVQKACSVGILADWSTSKVTGFSWQTRTFWFRPRSVLNLSYFPFSLDRECMNIESNSANDSSCYGQWRNNKSPVDCICRLTWRSRSMVELREDERCCRSNIYLFISIDSLFRHTHLRYFAVSSSTLLHKYENMRQWDNVHR